MGGSAGSAHVIIGRAGSGNDAKVAGAPALPGGYQTNASTGTGAGAKMITAASHNSSTSLVARTGTGTYPRDYIHCVRLRGLHGNGDGRNPADSARNPREWGQALREYRGDGNWSSGYPAGRWNLFCGNPAGML